MTSRSVHCSRSPARLGSGPAPQQRAERVGAVQGAVATAADVVGAAPVDELVPGRRREQHVAGRRAGQRRPDPAERVRVVRASATARRRPSAPSAARSPSTLQRRPREVDEVAAGGEAQLAASAADDRLARRGAPQDAGRRRRARDTASTAREIVLIAALVVERVDHRRALGRAEGDLGADRPRRARASRPRTRSNA